MSLPDWVVYFRGHPCCPCMPPWLTALERELIALGVVETSIDIAQLTGDAEASAGVHKGGGAFDIWQHDETTVWVCRQMGADATWARITGSFLTNRHTHGVLTDCPHNGPARYQIEEVRSGGDGLLGDAPDPGPRPLSGRTWREGIRWAEARQKEREEDMALSSDDKQWLAKKFEAIAQRDAANKERDIRRHQAVLAVLDTLEGGIENTATKAQVRRARDDIASLMDPEKPEGGEA